MRPKGSRNKQPRPTPEGAIRHWTGRQYRFLYPARCADCETQLLLKSKSENARCRLCALRARKTHGMSGHPLEAVFQTMLQRCGHGYGEHPHAKHYRDRGIVVCDEWRADRGIFYAWALAAGWQKGLEIDRRDNDGPYCPDNCRFVPHVDNCRNRRSSKLTAEAVLDIRRRLLRGEARVAIALQHGISRKHVESIKRNAAWKDTQLPAATEAAPSDV